jgi:hypothetical protein
LRSWASGELHYAVEVPFGRKTDAISNAIVALGKDVSVNWEEMKDKK